MKKLITTSCPDMSITCGMMVSDLARELNGLATEYPNLSEIFVNYVSDDGYDRYEHEDGEDMAALEICGKRLETEQEYSARLIKERYEASRKLAMLEAEEERAADAEKEYYKHIKVEAERLGILG